jgi:pimeloyl-ACP methyl ester carboxylesterase
VPSSAARATPARRETTLVILPGLDGTGARIAEFAQRLAPAIEARITVYPRDQPLGYDGLESFVRSALPQREPFFLLAESFAGPLAIRISADPPPGLAGVILCGTFAENPFPWLRPLRAIAVRVPLKSMPRWLRAMLMWGSGDPRRAPPQAARSMATLDSAVLRHRIAAILEVNETHRLGRLTLPVLILAARRDRIVPRGATRRLAAALPTAEFAEIDGPHLLLQSRPLECAAAVARFIDSCGLSGAALE